MCYEIITKEREKYYLTYVPDAKAYTDAPHTLAIFIKQRRRWMNGSLFGTWNVIKNFHHMVSCMRTSHNCFSKLLTLLFMLYYIVVFAMSFLLLGAMYTSIVLFLQNYLEQLSEQYEKQPPNSFIGFIFKHGILSQLFSYGYIAMMFASVIVSLTLPVDKGIKCFRVLCTIFGLLMTVTFAGMIYYLVQVPFYVDGRLQILKVAGIIMIGSFLVPILLRPLDFALSPIRYTLGLLAYLYMMPTYVNIFQIYAMCNLHDISWGNRPTTGQEAISQNKEQQEKLKADYMLYRSYFF